MNKNNYKKGFTLIELLVVITIIVVIASVLLVNLANTRTQVKDSKIKFEMNQIRTALEAFSPGVTYVNGCNAGTECFKLKAEVVNNGGTGLRQQLSLSSFCIQYTLNQSSTTYWCVDSAGYAGPPTAQTTCAAANIKCK